MPFVDRAAQGRRPGDGQPVQGRHRARRDAAAAPLPRQPGAVASSAALFFRSKIGDFHCGLRGFSRDSAIALGLQATGMEFASEMVVKAALRGQKIAEVPTTLAKDGRSRPPHLHTWRDGWRHLRFLLLFSPRWLFFLPGLVLLGRGPGHRRGGGGGPAHDRRRHVRRGHAGRGERDGGRSASRRCCSGCSPRCTPARRASCPRSRRSSGCSAKLSPRARAAAGRGGRRWPASSGSSSR